MKRGFWYNPGMMSDIKLVALDIEGTLTQEGIWSRLHHLVGISDQEGLQWFTQYYNKQWTFEQWADVVIARYKNSGISRHDIEAVLRDVRFLPQAKDTVAMLRQRYPLALLSSTPDVFVEEVAKQFFINTYYANYTFVYDTYDRVKNIQYLAEDASVKRQFLKDLCKKKGLRPEEIVYIGHSSNDLEAFLYTKRGILIGKGNEELIAASWKQVATLKEILPILS